MEWITVPVAFVLGMLTGGALFIGYGMYMMNKIDKAKLRLVDELKKKVGDAATRTESIKERLIQAAELARAQIDLRAQIEMPSKNALHSRYKNGLVREMNELEQQKISILRSILGDGFDPTITVVNDSGAKEEIPLSVYVANAEQNLGGKVETPSEPAQTPDVNEPKRIGKFVIYKGGKDDGTTH